MSISTTQQLRSKHNYFLVEEPCPRCRNIPYENLDVYRAFQTAEKAKFMLVLNKYREVISSTEIKCSCGEVFTIPKDMRAPKQQTARKVNKEYMKMDEEALIEVGLGDPDYHQLILDFLPGCGKTLLARALATESGANMILVRGPEILSKWVGESEKAIREIFRKAKASSPCVVIFDELDSLARYKSNEESVGETILSQLLTEMEEGVSSRVVVIGITNRPDLLDNSLLRAGRLDLVLFVTPPDEKGRLEIIKILTTKMPLDSDVKLQEIAVSTQNYTGADLASLCREAAVSAMQNNSQKISSSDFAAGLKKIRPSITKDVDQWYNNVKESISNVVPKAIDKTFYG